MRRKKRLFPHVLAFSALLLVLPAVCPAQETHRSMLSPPALQAASIIGVEPLLARLSSVTTLALSAGLGAVSGVLQFSDATKGVGDAIGFAAGGLSTLLSFRSLRQQHSEGRPAWVLPSMLAPFFSEPREDGVYPADTWGYLNSTPDGAASLPSRREQLVAQWLRAGRYPALDSPEFNSKIGLLTSTDAADKKLSMDLLSERAAMLADVRDEVAVMKRLLAEILSEIKVSRQQL